MEQSNGNTNPMDGAKKAASAASEAVKMGKTAALIAKGAATGGPTGAVVAAIKNPKTTIKLLAVLSIIMFLPLLLILMLPLIIFDEIVTSVTGAFNRLGAFIRTLPVIGAVIGLLFSGGITNSDYTAEYIYFDNAFDVAFVLHNLEEAHDIITTTHLEQFHSIVHEINGLISTLPEYDEGIIVGIEGDAFHFNTTVVLGMYSASLHSDIETISLNNLKAVLYQAHGSHSLFNYIVDTQEETRLVYPEPPPDFAYVENPYTGETETPGWVCSENVSEYVPYNWIFNDEQGIYEPPPPVSINITVHMFTVIYVGEMIFADFFGIADDAMLMTFAHEYARNLMSLLTDTDLGGWFGIVLEAGIVDGFYSPFPHMEWRISSPYGWRPCPFGIGPMEFHNGIDIPKPVGTPIRAVADGYVTVVQFNSGRGNWIRVDHGYIAGIGYVESEYLHNNRNLVSTGQRVSAGEVIAEVGNTGRSTGPHLHLNIRVNHQNVNPVSFIGTPADK